MHFKSLFLVMLCCVFIFTAIPKVSADQQSDVILRALINAGVITQEDIDKAAQQIGAEKGARQASVPQGIEDRVAALENKQSHVPKWVEKIKLKGDFRLRYESKKRQGGKSAERGRVRYRLGIESDIVDQVKVGAGLASGSDSSTSARSTNQDLQDVFSTKPFSLDYAYAEYTPADWVSIIGGKFKRKKYLWEPGDLLWDGDINPEGGSIQLRRDLTDWVTGTMNAGLWVVDESSGDSSDPYMFYVQPIIALKNKDLKADAKIAFTYYDFDNVRGNSLDGALGDNTTDTGTSLLTHKFNPLSGSAEIGFAEPFDLEVIPRIALFGEYVHNPDPSDENNGWLLGFKLGDKKVNNRDKLQFKYMYAQLQRDAFLDVLPDADRYSGGTNVRSHEGIIQYGLNKNVMVELDYYHSDRINGPSLPENLFQASANLKF